MRDETERGDESMKSKRGVFGIIGRGKKSKRKVLREGNWTGCLLYKERPVKWGCTLESSEVIILSVLSSGL